MSSVTYCSGLAPPPPSSSEQQKQMQAKVKKYAANAL